MSRRLRALAALALACVAGAAPAAAPGWTDALSGRLAQIRQSGVVRLGYRENAIPFSYAGPDGRPMGYTVDLCLAIVATIAADLDGRPLAVEYVPVTAQDRIDLVVAGRVDFECGATTATAERRRRVAFSPVIFVTGTRLLVARGSAARRVRDLGGKAVAVVGGTTNEAAMRELDRLQRLAIRFVVAADYREALARVATGQAAALAADDVLLLGLLADSGRADEFRVVGEMLSFEPYGIAFARDDPALADVVLRTLRGLAESREIVWIYDRWFVRPLPSGRRLDLPMSKELRRSLELNGLPAD
jgi:glutamate/aspartate transport system substrate-binding protein